MPYFDFLDPLLWDLDDINKWLCWIQREFILPQIPNKSLFPDNGENLCKLTFQDFLNIVSAKETAKVLYQNLNHLKRG